LVCRVFRRVNLGYVYASHVSAACHETRKLPQFESADSTWRARWAGWNKGSIANIDVEVNVGVWAGDV
jgi:hypothetical protein